MRGQVAGGADGTAYPILSDHLGSPRVVLDPSNGDRRWTWTTKEAFGLQAPNENPDSLTAGNFTLDARFPGQFLDSETGLFHNGYRDYDAKTGRYVESDPMGLGAGWNMYGYVSSNPAGYLDEDGLLQRNPNGSLKFTPNSISSQTHGSGYHSMLVVNGYLYTDKGNPVEAWKNVDPFSTNMATDCHGYSFADGQYWISNDQVGKILNDDGYKAVAQGYFDGSKYVMNPSSKPMQPGDIILYMIQNNPNDYYVQHSAVYQGSGKIIHKPGVKDNKPETGTISNGWSWRDNDGNPTGGPQYQMRAFRK